MQHKSVTHNMVFNLDNYIWVCIYCKVLLTSADLQSGAKLLGRFSRNNIAWREGEGMKYLAILEL